MSTFPGTADDIQDDVANTTLEQDLHPSLHNELASAVNAIETSLLSGGSFSLADHLAAADPHPQYLTPAEGLFLPLSGGTLTGPIKAPDGSLGAPSYSFTNQPDSGMWLDSGRLTVSTPGFLVLRAGSGSGWYVDATNGAFVAGVDGQYDIGYAGANGGRPRDLNLARNIFVGGGLALKVKAGPLVDADFTTPTSGMIAVDTTNSRIYVRVGTTWKYATLT